MQDLALRNPYVGPLFREEDIKAEGQKIDSNCCTNVQDDTHFRYMLLLQEKLNTK